MVTTLDTPFAEELPPESNVAATEPAMPPPALFDRRAWYRALAIGLGAYAISRVIVIASAYARSTTRLVDRQRVGLPIPRSAWNYVEETMWQWDGKWYRLIALHGYPEQLPDGQITYFIDEARVAFFPVYPYLSRWFDYVFPGGIVQSLLGLNMLLGAVAVVLVGVLARDLFDVATAERAMILFVLFPGSVVLTWAYAEATLIVCAAACFLFLLRDRWLLAGIFAAIATATRPNAIGLIAGCAVAAAIAIHRRRAWRSLAAVVLAPIGFVGFHLYLQWKTGESGAWVRVQREAWAEGTSWGATAVRYTWRFLEDPFQSAYGATYLHTVFALFALAVGLFCAWRKRLPWAMLAYVAGVVVLMLIPSTVSARPRFVFTAFPLVIAVAAWWPRRSRYLWDGLIVLSAGLLVAFTSLYAGFGAIP